jgi:hypothetical protein
MNDEARITKLPTRGDDHEKSFSDLESLQWAHDCFRKKFQ